jgi:dynein heavy chain
MMTVFDAKDPNKLIRVWVHEIARVIGDRLVTQSDQEKLFQRLFIAARMKLTENFGAALKDIIPKEASPGEEIELEKDVRTMM